MSDAFAPNTVLHSVKGQEIRVDCHCSEGSRLAVYDVTVNGEKKQLRWFKESFGWERLERLWNSTHEKMEAGVPGRFVFWPEDMTELSEHGFGYVTRPDMKDGISFREVLDGRYTFSSIGERINVGLNLALALYQLHNTGYCLENNCTEFWFSTRNSSVLFPETESIVPIGSSKESAAEKYCPPELLLRQSPSGVESDRYGLAMCLFLLLCGSHPLEGMRHLVPVLTPEVEQRLYAEEPLFLFDRENGENRPHPVIHRGVEGKWNGIPGYVQELFHRTFGQQGLQDPASRPSEGEWIAALCCMKNDRISCACGREIIGWEKAGCTCSRCGKPVPRIARLVFPAFVMPLVKGRKVYRCFLGAENPMVMPQPVAVVVEDEQRPGNLRLKNLGNEWTAYTPSGAEKKVQREETVPVMPGITIFMEGTETKIETN